MSTIYTRATKGSALTWTEGDANITNLNTDKIEHVVDDTTPQLGGNLDVNGNSIVSASNGNIAITPNGTGNVVLDGQNWPQAAPTTNGEYLTATSAGQTSWTDRVNAKTIYETVKNVTGSSISKGTPVYQVGITGNTITVGLARSDDPAKLAIGVLDEAIADEAEGRMIVLGEIKGVNTSAFATGDKVYLGATGGYTNVAPTSSSVARQFLGVVFRVDASIGSGYITGTLAEDQIKYTGTAFEFWDGDSWVTLVSEARGAISVTDTGGDGSLIYASATGVLTYTGPGASDYRAAFSAGTGISITDGVIANTQTSGITITDDTSTNATRYILFDDSTSGSQAGVNVASNKLTFNPLLGRLTTTQVVAAVDGIVGSVTPAAGTFTTVGINAAGELRLKDGDNSNYVAIKAPSTLAGDITYTLPPVDGSAGQVLSTSGTGTLSWTTTSGGVTLSDDTSTNATRYILFDDSTSGSQSALNVSSTKLTFNPSLGRLTTTQVVAALDGIVGSITPAAGTFTSLTANTSATLKAISEGAIYALGTTGGTVAPNVANGNVQSITLNSALTINAFTSPVAGQTLTLIITGGTSYTSITSTMKFAGGVKTLTGTAGCIDILTVYYDGTNYWASLGKDFK